MSRPRPAQKKLIVVGDFDSGTTTLLATFSEGRFPNVPRWHWDACSKDVDVDDKRVVLGLFNVIRGEEAARLRPLYYPMTDVVLFCFSVGSPSSLESIKTMWIREISHHLPGVPTLLVGCKADLRGSCNQPVGEDQGRAVAQKIGARYYLECSALTGDGVHEVFQHAARAALDHPDSDERRKHSCLIL